MNSGNLLRAKLANGAKRLGVWSSVLHTVVTESLVASGYDFVILDAEHGAADQAEILPHLQILQRSDCAPLVRAPWNDQVWLKRILDAGAESVMLPMIETAEEARAAVAACRYPPRGRRSFGPWRELGLSRDIDAWRRGADDRLYIILQIESAMAVENVDAIAAVDGVDALFIGPNDLSASLGCLRQYDHPDFKRAVGKAFDAIRRSGKPAGCVPFGGKTTAEHFRDGFSLIAANTELTLLTATARAEVDAHRAAFAH
jgi:4-hydroxy-2-oxoheptanedioate aldolase